MQVSDCEDNVPEEIYCFFDAEEADLVEIFKESAAVHVLKDKVDLPLLFEKSVEFDDFGMVE